MIEHALQYAANGWSVIPIGNNKKSLIRWKKYQYERADPEQIQTWWKLYPEANVGIVTGEISDLIVIDDDGEGAASIEAHGGLPETVTVKTAKGYHYYFSHPGVPISNFARKLPGLDLRGDGGYVLVPPSIHPTGVQYSWIIEPMPSQLLPVLPQWVTDISEKKKDSPIIKPLPSLPLHPNGHGRSYVQSALQKEADKVRAAPDGTKHTQLLNSSIAIGGFLWSGATSEGEIIDVLYSAVESRAEDKQNALKTIKDGLSYGAAKPRPIPEPDNVPNVYVRGRAAREWIKGTPEVEEDDEDIEPETDDENTPQKIPYSVKSGRTFAILDKTDKSGNTTTSYIPVCEFAAHIIEEITTEDGERSFKIQGRTVTKRPFEFEMPADDFSDDRKLKAALTVAAGAQAPIRKGMAGHLSPAIQFLTGKLIQGRRYNRTGWADGKFLIPGREPPNTNIDLPRKLPYGIDKVADLNLGLEALESLFRSQTVSMTVVAATIFFQAPLARLAGWHNERSAVFIAGRSGSLKSSWAQVGMCLYGPNFMNDDQLIKWGEGATRNAIMSFATRAHDLPFLIDNYKPTTGGGPRDFVNLIHNILEGGEKDRLNRSAQLRESRAVFSWPVVTGEDVPDNDAASLARVLVIQFPFPETDANPMLDNAQLLTPHLCAVGNLWIEWLESESGKATALEIGSRFNELRTSWVSRLKKIRSDMVNVNRVASNLATNELTWEAMKLCEPLASIVKAYDASHTEGLSIVAGEMAIQTAQSLEATRYLDALRQLLATEQYILIPRAANIPADKENRVIGWEDDLGSYLLPDMAYKAAINLLRDSGGLGGISKNTLHKQLDSLGVLCNKGAGGTTITKRCSGQVQRVLHFDPRALQLPDDDSV